MLLHKAGCREHGLIKGKAEFSSCRSCTDRQKTQKSLRHKPVFSAGGSPSLEAPDTEGCVCVCVRMGSSAQKIQKKHSKHQISHAEMGANTLGFWHCWECEMVNLVRWSRVQESVAVQTLECCSCLGAQLKYTNWEKGAWDEGGVRRQRSLFWRNTSQKCNAE